MNAAAAPARSARSARIAVADNGYFQIWERPCGCRVRVTTEDSQWERRSAARRGQLDAATKARLSASACRSCS